MWWFFGFAEANGRIEHSEPRELESREEAIAQRDRLAA